MKRIMLVLLLFCVVICPILVYAEESTIQIKSIKLNKSSDNAFEKEEASFQGGDIYLNLQMSELDDYIEYTIVLNNNSNEDLEIILSDSSSDYLKYSLTPKDNNSIVKKNSEKELLLRVEYINKVPNSSYSISDEIEQTVNLGVKITPPKNPKTGVSNWLIILPISLFLLGIYTMKDQNKLSNKYLFLLGTITLLSYNIVKASDNEITIHTNVILANYQYVYTVNVYDDNNVDETTIKIGERIPSSIIQYNNPQEAIEQLKEDLSSSNINMFLRHKITNNIVTESYVGVLENNKYFYFQGGGATYDSSIREYRNDSPYYEENVRLMNQMINKNDCYEAEHDGIKQYACVNDDYSDNWVDQTGFIKIINQEKCGCQIYITGLSYCGLFMR